MRITDKPQVGARAAYDAVGEESALLVVGWQYRRWVCKIMSTVSQFPGKVRGIVYGGIQAKRTQYAVYMAIHVSVSNLTDRIKRISAHTLHHRLGGPLGRVKRRNGQLVR